VVSARFGRSGAERKEKLVSSATKAGFEGKAFSGVLYAQRTFRSVESIDEVRNFKKVVSISREIDCGSFGRNPGAPALR